MEGECHFRLNRSASKFYSIRCDVYNRKVGFAWNFYLDSIESFDRKTFASPKAQRNAPGVSSAQGSSQRPSSRVEVPLKKEGGTFVVPVQINGAIALDFMVDSGAADVSVPADVFSTLTRTGTIRDTDIIGEQTYVLADGSEVKSTTFTIRSLKVGNKIVENVKGRIAPPNGSLLLGQSFLERFKSWSIDNTKHVLVLEPQTPSMTPTQITEAQKLGQKEPTKPARGNSLPENSTGASAKNADILRAMGELAGEQQICATYFTVVSACVKDQRADLANTYSAAAEKVGILAINTGRAAGVSDEAYAAQATLYTDAMMKAMGKNCTNIAVLLQRYVDFCQRLNQDADPRLMEWIACARAGREENCDGPGLPDPARNVK